mgnify:CR=1 FL=1
MRFHTLILSGISLLTFVGCSTIDTTGISPASSKVPRGMEASSIIVTEYADLQCPACKAAHTMLNKRLYSQYGNRVRFDFKQYPLRALHRYAFTAAQASECAADQGKFWEYIDYAYEHQEELKDNPHEKWASALNLNGDLFHRCLASGIKEDAVLADVKQGEALEVNGTPTYFVNGTLVKTNSLEEITKLIETAKKMSDAAPL